MVVSAGGAIWPTGDGGLQPAAAAGGAAGTPYVLQPPSADPSRPDPEPLPAASTTATTGTNAHTRTHHAQNQTANSINAYESYT